MQLKILHLKMAFVSHSILIFILVFSISGCFSRRLMDNSEGASPSDSLMRNTEEIYPVPLESNVSNSVNPDYNSRSFTSGRHYNSGSRTFIEKRDLPFIDTKKDRVPSLKPVYRGSDSSFLRSKRAADFDDMEKEDRSFVESYPSDSSRKTSFIGSKKSSYSSKKKEEGKKDKRLSSKKREEIHSSLPLSPSQNNKPVKGLMHIERNHADDGFSKNESVQKNARVKNSEGDKSLSSPSVLASKTHKLSQDNLKKSDKRIDIKESSSHDSKKEKPSSDLDEKNIKMRWPVRGRIISEYGQGKGNFRDGVDIQVPEGTPVLAAESGVVIYAGDGLKDFGNTVLIHHKNDLVTVYGHARELYVKRGEHVKRGQKLAVSGMSGLSESPRLHFEVRKNSTAVNPSDYLE